MAETDITIILLEQARADERSKIANILRSWKTSEKAFWAEKHFDTYQIAEMTRQLTSAFFDQLFKRLNMSD